MAAPARLKIEFTEDEMYHNLMIWLKEIRGPLAHLSAEVTLKSAAIEEKGLNIVLG